MKLCINCIHSSQPLAFGEYYCAVGRKRPDNPVTGEKQRAFCAIERADADQCGAEARNFNAREAIKP